MHRQGARGSGACHLATPWVSMAGAFSRYVVEITPDEREKKKKGGNIHQRSIKLPSFWHFEQTFARKHPLFSEMCSFQKDGQSHGLQSLTNCRSAMVRRQSSLMELRPFFHSSSS